MQRKNTIYLGIMLFIMCAFVGRQICAQGYAPFTPNVGQWDESFHHKLKLRWGQVFFHQNKLIFDTWDPQQYADILHCLHHMEDCDASLSHLRKHAYEQEWLHTNPLAYWQGEQESEVYVNYYLGNEPSRWKSGVRNVSRIKGHDFWTNTDIVYYEKDGYLKYDIILKPGADPSKVKYRLKHVQKVRIKEGALEIKTSVGEVLEMKPYVYQIINDELIEVACAYTLRNNIVGFIFPNGYNPAYNLIIDPQIIFSTFSGSVGDNWGTTATYDEFGNAYGGGILFNQSYPTTMGAYQTTLAGNCDVAITKYNQTGTTMLFSTLLGGLRAEIPYSMVVDGNNNLIVMGSTGSADFPVTQGCYDPSFNEGAAYGLWQTMGNSFLANYPQGSDFFVTKFNAQGTQLLGSTFVGGSGNEGFNRASGLNHNYGDIFRGEVYADANNDIYVIGTTQSTNFPVINAFQNNYGGGDQDAVVFKLSGNLSTLIWSSYFGGSGNDAGYGLQVADNGSVYFCGGTTSASIAGMNGLHTTGRGGVDGFVARCPTNGGMLQNATFIGSSDYDQVYFVQIDTQGDVFLMGQTHGNYPVLPPPGQNIFSVPTGSIFFHKLNPSLNQTGWCTRFGTNNANNKLVPGAFLVDNCNFISFSLWAGNANNGTSTSIGLPVTPDAYQSNTDGSDFYLGIFKHDAVAFHYGTFFGGPLSGEHVDGGTSRFDKNGIIYQAICAGCGSNNDMPTTPGAVSSINGSNNCNMAVIKFDLSEYSTIIGLPAQDFFCTGNSVQFTNLSTGNNSFTWFFGDGNSSTLQNPFHTYSEAGTYEVLLVSNGNSACAFNDTARVMINVQLPPSVDFDQFPPICRGDSIQLIVSGGTSYVWEPAPGLSLSQLNNPAPWVSPQQNTVYTVTTSNSCGSATGQISIEVIPFDINIQSPGNILCLGDSMMLQTSGATSYIWEPDSVIATNNGAQITINPIDDVMIYLTGINPQGCRAKDSLEVFILTAPVVQAPPDTIICFGSTINLLGGSPSQQVTWTNLSTGQQILSPSIAIKPDTVTVYELMVSNQCGVSRDSVVVDVSRIYPVVGPDITVCHSTPVAVFAEGGTQYSWLPSAHFQQADQATTILIPQFDTKYTVLIGNNLGCIEEAELPIRLYPRSHVSAGPDKLIPYGGVTTLDGSASPGILNWTPPLDLSCTACPNPQVQLFETREYTLTLVDTFGCQYSAMAKIMVKGSIYIPNAFTPNGDGINDEFRALGVDVDQFRMEVFTRNGELIYQSNDMMKGWNGQVNGRDAQMDVYVYVIYYTLNSGETRRVTGRVTLVQ
jgi:gliding motility-associated-like protein